MSTWVHFTAILSHSLQPLKHLIIRKSGALTHEHKQKQKPSLCIPPFHPLNLLILGLIRAYDQFLKERAPLFLIVHFYMLNSLQNLYKTYMMQRSSLSARPRKGSIKKYKQIKMYLTWLTHFIDQEMQFGAWALAREVSTGVATNQLSKLRQVKCLWALFSWSIK